MPVGIRYVYVGKMYKVRLPRKASENMKKILTAATLAAFVLGGGMIAPGLAKAEDKPAPAAGKAAPAAGKAAPAQSRKVTVTSRSSGKSDQKKRSNIITKNSKKGKDDKKKGLSKSKKSLFSKDNPSAAGTSRKTNEAQRKDQGRILE